MGTEWYPEAKRNLTFPGVGTYVDAPVRVVLHTTEGGSVDGALATYKSTGNYPHLTVGDRIEQHTPFSRATSALAHPPNSTPTNTAHAIQIEIVGHAEHVRDLPENVKNNLFEVLYWLHVNHQVPLTAPRFAPYPASYGRKNGVRFSSADWLAFSGICGHQHVPGNDHGDPGSLDVAQLISAIAIRQSTTQATAYDPTERPGDEQVSKYVSEFRWPTGALVRIDAQGRAYCYGLEYRGGIDRVPADGKKNWKDGYGVVMPVDEINPGDGYIIYSEDTRFKGEFTPEWARDHGI